MKNATIEELRTWVITNDRTQEAAFELVRRLRELVPLLEAINGDAALRPECAFIRVTVKEALALTKGGKKKR